MDDFTANQHVLGLPVGEVWHQPRLLVPFGQATLNHDLQVVCWPLLALLGCGGIFVTENNLEEEAEKLAGLFLIREEEHIDA